MLNYAHLTAIFSLVAIFDEMRDRYALMQVGWDRGRQVRGNLIYN
ncbi:MAG: element excision factor XisI family protein [Rhizonema sp. PD38]|nr:element excision factor XisI family protein [Rhizonema sp. PD38]